MSKGNMTPQLQEVDCFINFTSAMITIDNPVYAGCNQTLG
jgi:hypothetical protein